MSNTSDSEGDTNRPWTRTLNFHFSSDAESELPAKGLPKVQSLASSTDSQSESETEPSVSGPSDSTTSRKRSLSMSDYASGREDSEPPQRKRKGKGRYINAKQEMLAKGYRDAVERDEKLAQSRPQQSDSLEMTALNPFFKRIKVEEASSPDICLTGLSVPDFYTQYFDAVRAFLSKRKYMNPSVLASLKESGFTKYELRTMKGLDQSALVTRFTLLLSDDCRGPAQLESLAFAVFSASSADWATLNSVPMDV